MSNILPKKYNNIEISSITFTNSSSSSHQIGDTANRQINNTFLEMNGQIVSQTTYPTLFSILGHQPEFKFHTVELNPGLFPIQSIYASNFTVSRNVVARNGNNILAAGTGGLLYYSSDDGLSFKLGAIAPFGTTNIQGLTYLGGTWNRWIAFANGNNLTADSTDNGRTWVNRSSGNYNRWDYAFNSIDSIGIIVGSASVIMRSTNGTSWTQITTTAPSVNLRCASFATVNTVKTFITAGEGGVILYSTDNALTWAQVPDIPTWIAFNKLLWVGGTINKWVLGGNSDIVYTSPDGITWTQQSVSSSTDNIHDIETDPTQSYIVLAASRGALISSNGTTWSLTDLIGDGYSVMYEPSTNEFIVVGDSTISYIPVPFTSWTTIGLPRNKTIRSCIRSNSGDRILMFGDNGMVLSYNPTTKIPSIIVEPGYSIREIVYGNGVYVALCIDSDSSIFYSNDLINWTYQKINTNISNYGFSGRRLAFLNNNFIVLSTSSTIFTSPDGINWSERSISNLTKNDIIWTGTNYIISTYEGYLLYSPNLITWTAVAPTLQAGFTNVQSSNYIELCHLGSGIVIAVGYPGLIVKSTDHGVNWTIQNITDIGPYYFVGIACDENGRIAAVTREGSIVAYSLDYGDTWNTIQDITVYSSNLLTGVVYGNGVFVIHGRNSLIGVSSNLTDWEWVSSGGHFEIIDMKFANGVFMGAGLLNSTNAIATPIVIWSTDGKNWSQRAVPHSMIDTALNPKQRINYYNGYWLIPSYINTRSTHIWKSQHPYNTNTEFQIPTKYIGTGSNKMWIKASD